MVFVLEEVDGGRGGLPEKIWLILALCHSRLLAPQYGIFVKLEKLW